MNNKPTLWTSDFTKIILATILSIIGGEAMNFPISLLIFEETNSTLLSAIIMICGFLPDVVLGVMVAPFVDSGNKKKWIVSLDIVLLVIYSSMFLITKIMEFKYYIYLIFTLTVATVSVFYRMAYMSWYPDLITVGFEQKGFAVSSTLYPLISIIMTPVAAFMYKIFDISTIFLIVSLLLVISIIIESTIKYIHKPGKEIKSIKQWKNEIKEGFNYIRKEAGIRNIYTYMGFTQGIGEGQTILIQAFFQTHAYLGVILLGWIKAAEMIGRTISGMLQYKFTVAPKKRYGVTVFVYVFYETASMILLFTKVPFMLLNRFICGGLGALSATLRYTSVQSYLPADMRARVNAFFEMFFAAGIIIFQAVAGWLGQVMPYEYGVIVLGIIGLLAIFFLIILPREENAKVYEAERTEESL